MLNGSVLVLNRSWMAVHIANVKRALALLYRGHAKVVNPEDYATYDFEGWKEASRGAERYAERAERYIRTPNFRIRIPEIIVLTFYRGYHTKQVKFSRRNIFERDKNTCQYCGKKSDRMELTLDHVRPRSLGGHSCWENIVVACIRCNHRKANRLPEQAGMVLRRTPKKPP